jgi:hypothetical protein
VTENKRILAIASGGGHFVQLLRLRAAWEGHRVTYATVHAASAVDVAPAPLLTFRDVSRADWWRLPLTLLDVAIILLKVRPHVIITTGALPPLLALALVRPFGGAHTLGRQHCQFRNFVRFGTPCRQGGEPGHHAMAGAGAR